MSAEIKVRVSEVCGTSVRDIEPCFITISGGFGVGPIEISSSDLTKIREMNTGWKNINGVLTTGQDELVIELSRLNGDKPRYSKWKVTEVKPLFP